MTKSLTRAGLGLSRRWSRLRAHPGPSAAIPTPFRSHVVVAGEGHAADVGREILANGGNAIDAAIATAFALAVTLPEAGNLGGGGFIVAYLADRREVVTVDFREMAPRTSTPTMYLGPDGKPRPRYRTGAWSAGVPGTVRGWDWRTHGSERPPGPSSCAPPCVWRARAFPISAALARSLNRQLAPPEVEPDRPRARAISADWEISPNRSPHFGKHDQTPWKAGERLVQGDLALCLDRIATEGADEFYTGRTAKLIARYMADNGGFVSLRGPRKLSSQAAPGVHTTFRGSEVYSIGPPSSGGIVLCQMLNILERYDLRKDGRESPISAAPHHGGHAPRLLHTS